MAAGFVGMSIMQFLLFFLLGVGGLPLGYPPLPEDPALLRAVPAGSLAMLQWFGSGPAAKESPNATERLLAEEENRHLVAAVREALLKAALREEAGAAARIQAAFQLGEILLARPGVLFLSGMAMPPRPEAIQAGLVLGLGPEAETVRNLLAGLEPHILRELAGEEAPAPAAIQVGGVALRLLPLPEGAPQVAWGFAGSYFVVAVGQGTAEKILAGLAGGAAGLAGTSAFQRLQPQARVERPAWRSWVDLPALLALARPLMTGDGAQAAVLLGRLGLFGLGPFLSETGLEGGASASRALAGLAGEPQGLLKLLQGPPLAGAELAAIPGDATLAAAFRLSPAAVFRELIALLEAFPPEVREEFTQKQIPALERRLGVGLLEDLLQPLGDAWCLWSSPGQGGLAFTGLTLAVPVKDQARFGPAFAKVMNTLKGISNEERYRDDGDQRDGVWLDSFEFQGRTIWFLDSVGEEMPVAPAWCLDGSRLLAALFPQMLKAEISRPTAPASSLAAHPALQGSGEPILVSFLDLKEIVRLGWPLLHFGAQLLCDRLQDEGLDLNVSLLPSAAAILPHLGPQVCTVERIPEGFRQTMRGPLPALDPGLYTLALGMAVFGFTVAAPMRPPVEEMDAPVEDLDEMEARLMEDLFRLGAALQAFRADRGTLPRSLEELWTGETKYLEGPLLAPSGGAYVFRPDAQAGQPQLHAPRPYKGRRAICFPLGRPLMVPEERFGLMLR